MDIERSLRSMDKTNRDLVKKYVEAYKRTGDQKYAKEALAILENFDNDSDVRELIRTLKR